MNSNHRPIPGIDFEPGLTPPPYPHELKAAQILATNYQTRILFLKRRNSGSSADFKIMDMVWELKSPLGDGKRTIDNNLRDASSQSDNVILDLTRCKMHDLKAISKAKHFLASEHNNIKKLKVITKSKKVIDLKSH